MTALITPAGRLDRRAVMTEAHRQFRLMRRYGWSFGRCLSFAWAKARAQRVGIEARPLAHNAPMGRIIAAPIARGRTDSGRAPRWRT
jgi:hypothetical protein